MRTFTNLTLAALVATSFLSGCDYGGSEEEQVLFRLVRENAPARLVLDGSQDDDGCSVIDMVPGDGTAVVKDVCAIDQKGAAVMLPEGFMEMLKPAAGNKLSDGIDRRIKFQTASGERLDLLLTADLSEAIEEIYEQAEEAGSSGQQVDIDVEKDAPEQPAVGMFADSGFIFGADSIFDALPTKVDILAYSGSTTMDLVPGVSPVTQEQAKLHLFTDDHGEPILFNDLHEIPNYILTEADTDMVRDARQGMGFIVENNVSGGITYVFVKQVSNTKVELEYQAVE